MVTINKNLTPTKKIGNTKLNNVSKKSNFFFFQEFFKHIKLSLIKDLFHLRSCLIHFEKVLGTLVYATASPTYFTLQFLNIRLVKYLSSPLSHFSPKKN